MFIPTSLLLARVLGLLLIVAPISLWLNQGLIGSMMDEFKKSPGLLWLSGLAALIIGSVILSLNNVWRGGASIIVAIVGWLAFLKGIMLLLFPKSATKSVSSVSRSWVLQLVLIIYFLCGIYLFCVGFFGHHF